MNNYSYKYGQVQYMNRAERRKNKINTEKTQTPKCNYTTEELGEILKRELNYLINMSCSEAIKRERYRRLEPLIREYQRQLAEKKPVAPKKRTNLSTQAYNKQKELLKCNPTYQRLMNNSYQVRKTSNVAPQRVISSYENYTKPMQSSTKVQETTNKTKSFSNNVTTTAQKISPINEKTKTIVKEQKSVPQTKVKTTKKKSIFRAILDFFKPPKPVVNTVVKIEKPTISKPKISEKPKAYFPSANIVTDAIYSEFDRQLRNFKKFNNEVTGYKYYKNGRAITYDDIVLG